MSLILCYRPCFICCKLTTKKCIKCQEEYYCSRKCQKYDSNHKSMCTFTFFFKNYLKIYEGKEILIDNEMYIGICDNIKSKDFLYKNYGELF
jgi:hypothetical protein